MSPTTEAFSRIKIDALLKDAGWNLTDGVSILFEHALPDGSRADYALCDRSGRPVAAVEAKREAENPHPKGRPKPGKFRRGPLADAVRALHPARATGQRQSVVPEMPPVPQEGPLTRPGATNAGRDTFFLPNQG